MRSLFGLALSIFLLFAMYFLLSDNVFSIVTSLLAGWKFGESVDDLIVERIFNEKK